MPGWGFPCLCSLVSGLQFLEDFVLKESSVERYETWELELGCNVNLKEGVAVSHSSDC